MPKQTTPVEYSPPEQYLAAAPLKVGTLTLDTDLFTAGTDGKITLQPGLVLSRPSDQDQWGPYESGASDGRETASDNVVLLNEYVDDLDTDKEVSFLINGIAKGAKVHLADGSVASAAIRTALRSQICDVLFEVESND